jgi:hypothetical protein
MKSTKTLKVGDEVEMNYLIPNQIIIAIVSDDRVDVRDVQFYKKEPKGGGIGVPVSWIKRKI